MKDKELHKRLVASYKSAMSDLRKLWEAYTEGEEDRYAEDIGNIFEYGLCFDYVPKSTFKDQRKGYFRYKLSYSGPSEEFRFYVDETKQPYKIEYWFLDWFCGTYKTITGKDEQLMLAIWDWFQEGGAVEKAIQDTVEA